MHNYDYHQGWTKFGKIFEGNVQQLHMVNDCYTEFLFHSKDNRFPQCQHFDKVPDIQTFVLQLTRLVQYYQLPAKCVHFPHL